GCSRNGLRVTLSSNCETYEYGDITDVMGAGLWHCIFTAEYMRRAGWISSGNVVDVTGTGDFHLAPLEQPTNAPVLLRIPGDGPEQILVEYRFPPADATQISGTVQPVPPGIYLKRLDTSDPKNPTQLLDTTVSGAAPPPGGLDYLDWFDDAALAVGR